MLKARKRHSAIRWIFF